MLRSLFVAFLCFAECVWGVASCERTLLIIGSPRSRLEEASALLTRAGLDLPANFPLGQDGLASWLLALTPPPGVQGPLPERVHFEHIFHQVRHPLREIAELVYGDVADLVENKEYLFACIPEISPNDIPFVKRVKIWYYVNLAAEEKAEWSYRVENMRRAFPKIEHRLGIALNHDALEEYEESQLPKVLTWKKLEEKLTLYGEQELFLKVKALASRYGYQSS